MRIPVTHPGAILMLVMLAGGGVYADEPQAGAAKAERVSTWLAGLADADPAVRHESRVALLGLKRDDLEVLRDAVAAAAPLLPSQAAALPEIVTHVYLTGEAYTPVPDRSFMGVTMSRGRSSLWTSPGANAEVSGVIIVSRAPGFGGFRTLLEGDVIVGVAENPDLPIRQPAALSALIQPQQVGSTVHLMVLRNGQMIQVPVTLDAFPEGIEREEDFSALRERRTARAEAYWNRTFAPILEDQPL